MMNPVNYGKWAQEGYNEMRDYPFWAETGVSKRVLIGLNIPYKPSELREFFTNSNNSSGALIEIETQSSGSTYFVIKRYGYERVFDANITIFGLNLSAIDGKIYSLELFEKFNLVLNTVEFGKFYHFYRLDYVSDKPEAVKQITFLAKNYFSYMKDKNELLEQTILGEKILSKELISIVQGYVNF